MKKHKKQPIRNNATMVTVKIKNLEKAAAETATQAKTIVYEALQQQFGFGPLRIARLQATVAEMERHKSFDAWVDYSLKQKMN